MNTSAQISTQDFTKRIKTQRKIYGSTAVLLPFFADGTTINWADFERHLRLTETLPLYFGAVAALAPLLVEVIEADGVQSGAARIQKSMVLAQRTADTEALRLLGALTEWLQDNEA